MVAAGNNRLNLGNIRDEVYRVLQAQFNHEYPPGFRFDLSHLESQLGVSRTPLKEALQRLEAEGLIEIRPRRGTFVIDIDPTHIAENFEVRRILECAAAEIVVERVSNEEISQLRAIAQEMSHLLVSDDYQRIVAGYIELDRQFHRLLISLAHNGRLTEVWNQLDTHVQVARVRQKFARLDSQQHTETEHEAILQALQQRDKKSLVKVLTDHIERSKARTLKALEKTAIEE